MENSPLGSFQQRILRALEVKPEQTSAELSVRVIGPDYTWTGRSNVDRALRSLEQRGLVACFSATMIDPLASSGLAAGSVGRSVLATEIHRRAHVGIP